MCNTTLRVLEHSIKPFQKFERKASTNSMYFIIKWKVKVLVNQKYLYQKPYQNTLDTSGDTRTCKNNHILKCLLNIH